MNMVRSAAIAAVGLITGVSMAISALPSFQPQPNQPTPQPVTEPQSASPVAQPVAQSMAQSVKQQPYQVSVPVKTVSAASASFDSLSPCEQLDSVAKSGQSVAEFLVAANRVNDLAKYKVAIGSVCPWNAEQLQVADRIVNSPVVVVKQRVGRQSRAVEASGSSSSVKLAPIWNNCNGIQESGESYSARCERAQELNDAGLGNASTQRIDNRNWDTDRPANGYSGKQ